jgi:hypothetical protein
LDFLGFLDSWIFDIENVLNIQLLWIFGVGFGWMFNHPYWKVRLELKAGIQLFWVFLAGFGWTFSYSSNPKRKLTSISISIKISNNKIIIILLQKKLTA